MKILRLVLLFGLYGLTSVAQVLEVPEKCFSEKKVPCLLKIQSQPQDLVLNQTRFRANKDTLIQWDSFDQGAVFSLLKGGFQLENNYQDLKIDGVVITAENALIEKKEKNLYVLNLKNFILANYSLSEVQANSVLFKTVFLEKNELLQYVSHFFSSRQTFKAFVQSIEQSWKKELISQADVQTKVLKRAIASVELRELKKKQEFNRDQQSLKKVREEFFYRTFYR